MLAETSPDALDLLEASLVILLIRRVRGLLLRVRDMGVVTVVVDLPRPLFVWRT